LIFGPQDGVADLWLLFLPLICTKFQLAVTNSLNNYKHRYAKTMNNVQGRSQNFVLGGIKVFGEV